MCNHDETRRNAFPAAKMQKKFFSKQWRATTLPHRKSYQQPRRQQQTTSNIKGQENVFEKKEGKTQRLHRTKKSLKLALCVPCWRSIQLPTFYVILHLCIGFFHLLMLYRKKSKWCTFCCLGNGGLTLEGILISIMTVHQSGSLIGLPFESFPAKICQNFQKTFNQRELVCITKDA